MRMPPYNRKARRKTVSVTLNADLVARSATHGINISGVAKAVQFADELAPLHGHPFPKSRAMFMPDDEATEDRSDDAA